MRRISFCAKHLLVGQGAPLTSDSNSSGAAVTLEDTVVVAGLIEAVVFASWAKMGTTKAEVAATRIEKLLMILSRKSLACHSKK